jgi:hypothetical protein
MKPYKTRADYTPYPITDGIVLTNTIGLVCDPVADCVFIGPTKLDFSMLSHKGCVAPNEPDLIKQWKEEDLTSYYRSLRRW